MPTHGTSLWTFEASDEISGLDVAGDMVFVGSGSMVSGLDAATGTPRWRFHATLDGDSPLRNEVTLAAGTDAVFVATGSSVVALDATTGRHLWFAHLGPIPRSGALLGVRVAVADDMVYATLANRVVALNPTTGRPHWTHEVAQRLAGSPRSEAGRVFVTSGSDIEALDQATGTLLWRYGNGSNDASYLTVSQGIVVKTSHELGVVAVVAVDAASGEERWTATVGGRGAGLNEPSVVSDGVVLVLGRDGRIYALELATGAERWAWPDRALGGGETVEVAPAAYRGVVYAANATGRLYAIDVRRAGEPPADFGVTGGHPVTEGSIASEWERGGWRTSATQGLLGSRKAGGRRGRDTHGVLLRNRADPIRARRGVLPVPPRNLCRGAGPVRDERDRGRGALARFLVR